MTIKMITKNFSAEELGCRCGHCTAGIQLGFARHLQELRDTLGIPLPISSGVRCTAHNAAEGGAPNSRHIYGDAVDICWTQMSGEQKLRLITTAYKLGFVGFGFHKLYLHLDDRQGNVVQWFY